MKTQLLEDIGQSAAVSLTPPRKAGDPKAEKAVPDPAPAGEAKSRPALGVWSRKTTWEPPRSVTRQADQQPTPLELHQVFEEIAALEAQYVPPGPQPRLQPQPRPQPESRPQPATAPAEPRQARPDPAPGVVHQPAVGPAEPTLHMRPAQGASAPQDPLFDFSPPAPPAQPMPAADPFTPAGSRPARSGKRYLLWGGCLLAGALLIQGGRWLYQEGGDAVAPGLARGAATGQQAVPLKPLETGADDRPAQPVVSARRPADDVPPLVMLEADPPAAAPVERPVADRAEQASAPVLPKPASQATRKEPAAVAKAARTTDRSSPVRPVGGTSAAGTPGQASRDSAMAATLQACRAYGYDAAQCVKRACSITRYGFACRGR